MKTAPVLFFRRDISSALYKYFRRRFQIHADRYPRHHNKSRPSDLVPDLNPQDLFLFRKFQKPQLKFSNLPAFLLSSALYNKPEFLTPITNLSIFFQLSRESNNQFVSFLSNGPHEANCSQVHRRQGPKKAAGNKGS